MVFVVSPIDMVCYVSEHQHKDNLGTLGSAVERLETFWKPLIAFRAFWERMGAFSRLGRLGRIIPYGMYGIVCT